MTEFCLFMATIRPRHLVASTLANLYSSLTRPTDVHIAYGIDGKSRAQDAAIYRLAHYYEYWAAIDDDIQLPRGWQDFIVQAFADVPKLGAAGVEYLDNAEHRAYMMEVPERQRFGLTDIRILKHPNITGACIVTPTAILRTLPPVPVIDGVTYEYYEDGWRCKSLRERGYCIGYVRCMPPGAVMISYPDSQPYLDKKQRDIATAKQVGIPGLV